MRVCLFRHSGLLLLSAESYYISPADNNSIHQKQKTVKPALRALAGGQLFGYNPRCALCACELSKVVMRHLFKNRH